MSEEILINITPREARVALVENGVLQEIHIERSLQQGRVGSIYKGRVLRLLPGIQAAFVDIGLDRSGFLHVSDVKGFKEPIDIRELLQPGQEILVQVYKDPLGTKGARLTTNYSIPSRYLVFTPGSSQIAVSQKITDEDEIRRLQSLIEPTSEGGFIFRTVAESVTLEEASQDKEFLQVLWQEIKTQSQRAKIGDCVYEEIPIVLRVVRDLAGLDIERIRVDQLAAMQQMRDLASKYQRDWVNRIEFFDQNRPIFDIYSIEDEIEKSLQRKVYLKSGGYLVIDQTEAMTTVDVNTGSYVGYSNLEQTSFKTNLEAAIVIARQIRLRNLGGIIIIDFIDMEDSNHKVQLLQHLKEALSKDRTRTEISELSSLGLVQLTRKRTRESLSHILCVSCPLCRGRGAIKSLATIAYDIFRELKRISQIYHWPGYLVVGSEALVEFLLEEESSMLAEAETQLGKPIRLRVESSYIQEHYDILPLSTD